MLGTNKLHGLRWSFLILLLLLFTLFAPLIALASPFVISEGTSSLTWTTKEVMPMTIGRAASGVVQDKIYVLGGSITGAGAISGVEMYDPASNSWEIKTSLIEPRYATGNATIGSIIYLVGGAGTAQSYRSILAYNTSDGSSSQVATLISGRHRASCAVVDDKIYTVGGDYANVVSSSIEEFDPSTNTSTPEATLLAPRTLAAVASVGGKIYIMGGMDSSYAPTNTCWEYDPATNSFTEKSTMPVAIAGNFATTYNGKIYLSGGITSQGLPPTSWISDVQEYNPATDTWRNVGSVPTSRYSPVAEVVGSTLYVMGGHNGTLEVNVNEAADLLSISDTTPPSAWATPAGGNYTSAVSVYLSASEPASIYYTTDGTTPTATSLQYVGIPIDIITTTTLNIMAIDAAGNISLRSELYTINDLGGCPTFLTKASMPTARLGANSGVVNNMIWVLGGSNRLDPPPRGSLATVEMYDPNTDTWQTKPSLPAPRFSAGGATLGNIIYLAGGDDGTSTLNTVLAYNTLDGSCTQIGTINIARFRTDADIINGKIYIAGGQPAAALNSIEEYDLSENTSTIKATLPEGRDFAAVVAFNNKLYIIGGFDSSGNPTNTCWEYNPATNLVTPKSPMPIARGGKQVFVMNGKIYVGGGITTPGPPPMTYIGGTQEYDPATDTWMTMPCAPPTPRWGAVTEVANNSVYAIGGCDNVQALSVNEAPAPITPPDTIPPTAYASPIGGTYSSDQAVTLSASEPAAIYYTLDGTDPTPASPQYVGMPISIIATTTLKFMAIDTAGNPSQVYVESYTIDAVAPTPVISISGIEGQSPWYTSDVQITLSATDEGGAGVASLEYSLDNINWSAYTGPFTITREGTSGVYYRATDYAGNTQQLGPAIIQIDKTKPVHAGSQSGTLGQNGWYISDVQVTLTASDSVSGVQKIERSPDGINWITYTGLFMLTTEGTRTGHTRSVDNAGNVGDVKQKVTKIDKSDPTTAINIGGTLGQNGWYKSDVLVTLTAADAISGVAVTEYSFDNSQSWLPYTGEFPVASEGITTIYFRSIDNAGRVEEIKSLSVKIDKTMPGASISATGTLGENNRYISDVTVALSAADAVSGLSGIEYSFDNTTWNAYASSFVVSNEGTTTVYYRAVDLAGNVEVAKQLVIVIDRIAPVVSSTDPANGSLAVPVNKTIVVTFGENIQVGANFGAITLKKNKTDIAYTASVSGNTLIVKPNADLTYNTTFDISIPAGAVKDMAGHAPVSLYALSFTTVKR